MSEYKIVACDVFVDSNTLDTGIKFAIENDKRELYIWGTYLRRIDERMDGRVDTITGTVHRLLETMVNDGMKVTPELRSAAITALAKRLLPHHSFKVPPRGKAMNIDAEREKAEKELHDALGMSVELFFELYGAPEASK